MPPKNLEAVKSIYDERSEKYDENEVHVKQAHDYISWAELKPGSSVLDLACGTGLVTLEAKRVVGASSHVVGVDISEGMLSVARRKAKEAKLNIPFIYHDISDLSGLGIVPTDSKGFDVITCASALILLEDPLRAVKAWKNVLKSGGRIVTDVQTKDANIVMNIFAEIAPGLGERLPWDAQRWQSKQVLEDIMVDAGLKVEKIFETDPYAVTELEKDKAAQHFDQAVMKSMFKTFDRDDIRDKAKDMFVEKWKALAGSSQTIREECRYWVVIASKST